MSNRSASAIRTTARWCGRAIIALGHPVLLYDLLVGIAARFAPPGKARRRLARKFGCAPAMVPDAIVCYTAIYALVTVIIFLCIRALVMIFAD